ncbi:MAG: L-2-hydroxyglutarate oxidase, partial [Saprospiraceae bacterium]|nr:L-2-hydroxyglutarate oxidase [Saprospiraceae bacterium]
MAIVGAGIVGLATAYELMRQEVTRSIVVLDKESRIAAHQSSRNSGVIHSGIYYQPGSKKAVNCLEGYHRLLAFAREHEVPHKICGKVILAKDASEVPVLRTIHQRGEANGLQGISWLDRAQARQREPAMQSAAGIWVPQAGIIDYQAVCTAMSDWLEQRGARLLLGHQVEAVHRSTDHVELVTTQQQVSAKVMINCAGLYADTLAAKTGMRGPFRIMPFRGEFYQLKPPAARQVQHLVYPVPDLRFPFLGVHFTL